MIKRAYLEITDACNLNCPFCTNEKGHFFMSLKDIEHCIDDIKEVCDYIYLHVLGEPLLHPDFESVLEYLDSKDMKLQLVTNGVLLRNYPDLTRHRCLRKLSISVHSISGLNMDEDYFIPIVNLIKNKKDTVIELRFYDREHLDTKLLSLLERLEKENGFVTTDRKNSYSILENVYIHFEDFFNWPNISDPFISSNGSCQGGRSQIAILHNLDVTLCCLDAKGYNVFGNLRKEHLKDVLESQIYKNIVKEMNNGILSKELCQKCTYRLRFSKQ